MQLLFDIIIDYLTAKLPEKTSSSASLASNLQLVREALRTSCSTEAALTRKWAIPYSGYIQNCEPTKANKQIVNDMHYGLLNILVAARESLKNEDIKQISENFNELNTAIRLCTGIHVTAQPANRAAELVQYNAIYEIFDKNERLEALLADEGIKRAMDCGRFVLILDYILQSPKYSDYQETYPNPSQTVALALLAELFKGSDSLIYKPLGGSVLVNNYLAPKLVEALEFTAKGEQDVNQDLAAARALLKKNRLVSVFANPDPIKVLWQAAQTKYSTEIALLPAFHKLPQLKQSSSYPKF